MQTILAAGSIVGIGKEAAPNLAKLGHRILGLHRETDKSKLAHKEIVAQTERENRCP